MLKCCFTSTETVGLLGTGAQDGHLDSHAALELSVTGMMMTGYKYIVLFSAMICDTCIRTLTHRLLAE